MITKPSKRFSNYQNPVDLPLNLRDGNINLKEVLKNQTNFKSMTFLEIILFLLSETKYKAKYERCLKK